MRNVILSMVLVLGCSSEGDGLVGPIPDAGSPRGGAEAYGTETGLRAADAQPRASQDAQAPDSVVVTDARPAQPDAFVMAPDTHPPVTWEPGPETTDPALMVCPPTKGNSLGIGAPCTVINQDVMCKKGLACLCGGKTRWSALDDSMPCFCSNYFGESSSPKSPCSGPCGEGAGCCYLDLPSGRWQRVCLPTACASYCRL